MVPDNAYGNVVEAAFKQAVGRKGGRIVAFEKYGADRATAARTVAQGLGTADALFLADDGDSVVTVADANGASATASFSLAVNNAVTATQAIASTTLTQNHAATSFTPVTGSGGTGSLTYSVSPSLPRSSSLSASTIAMEMPSAFSSSIRRRIASADCATVR